MVRVKLVNFHLGWFTKKGPTSPQKTMFSLHFMKDFGTCGGLFWGTNPSGKLAGEASECCQTIYYGHQDHHGPVNV